MHSIRIHPVVACVVLLGCALLALARGQQVQRLPTLTAEQAEILSHMSIVYLDDGQGGQAKTVRFTGVNVQVVNGLGATSGNPAAPTTNDPSLLRTNGLGNLIVGYNEAGGLSDDRSGSHCVVMGYMNDYKGIGCMVSGSCNEVSGLGSLCLASFQSVSANNNSAVIAADTCQLVGGSPGQETFSAIIGSWDSAISGPVTYYDVIPGGQDSALFDAVGCALIAGTDNLVSESNYSSIVGGSGHTIFTADRGVVAGGQSSYMEQAGQAVIVGGESNQVLVGGDNATVLGGQGNQATGRDSVVGGGLNRWAVGLHDWVAGSLFEDD